MSFKDAEVLVAERGGTTEIMVRNNRGEDFHRIAYRLPAGRWSTRLINTFIPETSALLRNAKVAKEFPIKNIIRNAEVIRYPVTGGYAYWHNIGAGMWTENGTETWTATDDLQGVIEDRGIDLSDIEVLKPLTP